MDMLQQSEYTKLQSLFKQNGNIMTEACKLIHHLDDFTWHSNNPPAQLKYLHFLF